MYYIVYGLLWTVSLLPLRVLYIFSDAFYVLIYYIFQYRKDIVVNNLALAFPEKTEKERISIAKQFYHNLIDTFIESIKFITISRKEIEKRSSGEFNLINQLIEKGNNIHLMAAHQFNWEFANLLYALNLKIPFVGVYMPITSKILDRIFYKFRAQFGTILIAAPDFKNKIDLDFYSKQYILALAADQNPGDPSNAYWMNFFGKPVPFITGPGKGAVKNNTSVVMVGFNKRKRGFYHFSAILIADDASAYTPEHITLLYKNSLEKIIREDPANYLWSHRRWKYDWKPDYGKLIN